MAYPEPKHNFIYQYLPVIVLGIWFCLVLLFAYHKAYAVDGIDGVLQIQDQKASGTDGGSAVAGVQVRTLNTEVVDTIGSTLSSNTFTLPAGTYYIRAISSSYRIGLNRLSLFNVTNNATTTDGIGVRSDGAGAGGGAGYSMSELTSYFVSTTTNTFKLNFYAQSALATQGLGLAQSKGTEIFTDVFVLKYASTTSGGGGTTYNISPLSSTSESAIIYMASSTDRASVYQIGFYGLILFFISLTLAIWMWKSFML